MKQKTQGMIIVGLHHDLGKGDVYKVWCDVCTRKFEVSKTFSFAKCECGAFQRLSEVVAKLPEDAPGASPL